MIVQNRCYASMGWDQEVREICKLYGLIYQGFSLLTANRHVLIDPEVQTIAQRLRTGTPQVIFRFALDVGMQPLTGTTSAQHMKEDLETERLSLTADDIDRLHKISL